tara:strand:+ start:280 stop:1152 length:873 start_codon:yes stop_codon:yes gene_type:complete
LVIGFFIGKVKPLASEKISLKLIRYGIPISVMGLLLKAGINVDLVNSALLAFTTISIFIIIINYVPALKNLFPNVSLQLAGLIGNTSFLGIPIAIALLPTETINLTIGFDLGTTLFSWIFGPYLLQKKSNNYFFLNFRKLLFSIFNSPASRGVIGALIIYLFNLENLMEDFLWLPARFVIYLAIIVVGARLGTITNDKKLLFKFDKNIKNALFLKLIILPGFIYIVCLILNLQGIGVTALVLQAGTPSAISTILLAEAYKRHRDLAAKALFSTTIISSITIPILYLIINQ